ncbi:MAG: DUF5615 family PIN-like protein [Nostoc sp.]|uniref:DUF5615 family PIN-like protein n=1 Tax=Nostoc sp. TaxID=1180 RepID=UPI002FFC9E05
MLRFLADENLNNQIVRGVLRRNSNIDIVRVQDVGLTEIDDATVLEWAAQNERVVLTQREFDEPLPDSLPLRNGKGGATKNSAFCSPLRIGEGLLLRGQIKLVELTLTHDLATMTNFAYERLQAGLAMPGLFEISRRVSVGLAIEEILLLDECSLEGEWEGQVRFLPLR